MANNSIVEQRDYTLIIDKSGSMSTQDQPGGKSRWQAVQDSTLALAKKCEELDPDGITVYLFSGRFKRYDHVTSDKVMQVFAEHDPMGKTDLATVLYDALTNYFDRKEMGQTQPNGETIIVITDGEPDDRKSVMRLIIEASRKIDRDEELGISLIQVGRDKLATQFLEALDDQLEAAGAKFDIVNTVKITDVEEGMSLSDVLLNAVIA
ncbi:VWA domain-containing protein [Spirulina sp. CCNP1310]|nr:VWA domain-containing protein [Spirulina sp. CCNP1310]MEA5418862.1 VWA domain-containing protein [Spirulina sp. CCNP1310]